MHAASREALANATLNLDNTLSGIDNAVVVAAQTGTEIFDVVDVLDGDRGLRVAVAEASAPAEQRSGLVKEVFGGKVSAVTLALLTCGPGVVHPARNATGFGCVGPPRSSPVRRTAGATGSGGG